MASNTLIQRAIKIAKNNTNPSHPQYDNFIHFSFIIQSRKIIAWGTNKNGTPELHLGYPNYSKIHSEVVAYQKAKYYLNPNKSFEVINLRLSKSHKLKLSKPCNCCINFLAALNCKKITFSCDNIFAQIKL